MQVFLFYIIYLNSLSTLEQRPGRKPRHAGAVSTNSRETAATTRPAFFEDLYPHVRRERDARVPMTICSMPSSSHAVYRPRYPQGPALARDKSAA